eukprot:TRINITY_DN6307_c0_g1_i4.p1 TRINITY_DN6307_c0_g1~~TRINITY_DN6307_c0_g1_i4.p1  ORF type:complete len:1020 (+),score=135.01 TRINITY_DN6307_c0_g1_i4:37-3096(+)
MNIAKWLLIASLLSSTVSDECHCANDYLFSDTFCGSHWGDPDGKNESMNWCYITSDQNGCDSIIDGNETSDNAYPPYEEFVAQRRVSKIRAECSEPTPWLQNPFVDKGFEPILPDIVIGDNDIIDVAISDESQGSRLVATATRSVVTIYRLTWYTNFTDMTRAMQWSYTHITRRGITKIAFHPNQPILVIGGDNGKILVYEVSQRGLFLTKLLDYTIPYEEPSELLRDYYGKEIPLTKAVSIIAINNNVIVAAVDRRLFSVELGFIPIRIIGTSEDGFLFLPQDVRCTTGYCGVLITGISFVASSLFVSTSDGAMHTLTSYGVVWSDSVTVRSEVSYNPPPLYRVGMDILRNVNLPRAVYAAIPDTDTEQVRGIRKWTVGYSSDLSKRKQLSAWWLSDVTPIHFETASTVESFIVLYYNRSGESDTSTDNTTRTYTIDIYEKSGSNLVLSYRTEIDRNIPEQEQLPIPPSEIDSNATGTATYETCWEFGSATVEDCAEDTDRCLPLDIHNPVNYSCLPSHEFYQSLEEVFEPAIDVALSPTGTVAAVTVGNSLQILVSEHDRNIPPQEQPPVRTQTCTFLDSSGIDNTLDCLDGTRCPASNPQCCIPHGGVVRCPPEAPQMCDYSCEPSDTPVQNLTLCCKRSCGGHEVRCEEEVVDTTEGYTLRLGNLRRFSGEHCIPGFDQISNEQDCYQYSLYNNLGYKVWSMQAYNMPPCSIWGPTVVWNPTSWAMNPPPVMPKSTYGIENSFEIIPNATLPKDVEETRTGSIFEPYLLFHDRNYGELECMACCMQDPRCTAAVTVPGTVRSCLLFNETNSVSAATGNSTGELVPIEWTDLFLKKANLRPNATPSDVVAVNSIICELQKWVPLETSENCVHEGLYEIRSFLECIRAVEYLRGKGGHFENIMQPTVIRSSSEFPGCMLHVNENKENTVTYNVLSAPEQINDPATDKTICGITSDWKPSPPSPTGPPTEQPTHRSTLIYLPTAVYIVFIFGVLGCLVGMAMYALGRRPGYVVNVFFF